ncbi:ABC transporter ATP-binding protein [Janibacter limosus]|uniref:Energy-coupling factor ABC transporter ATP-binding protein n=1 Tax=Janibacter limosus TaxID=53458 RepID=A0AC61U1K3_9MICO|nr:ABC transporter ATP-binding protein [Janibacter limosus]UUZ43899.1 ABC transporter ATP-binding protein [Janibacter limosus]
MLHLNGVLAPTSGSVAVSGLPVVREHLLDVRRRVGIVFRDPDDQLFMTTVAQDVAFGPRNLGLSPAEVDQRVADALDAVGMGDVADRAPHHLSFGQKRRVAVATVPAMRPEILVLDEPSSNLDPASRRELAEIVDGPDITVLMVTHDLPYALQLCRAVGRPLGRPGRGGRRDRGRAGRRGADARAPSRAAVRVRPEVGAGAHAPLSCVSR